jgi:hypothetical protein
MVWVKYHQLCSHKGTYLHLKFTLQGSNRTADRILSVFHWTTFPVSISDLTEFTSAKPLSNTDIRISVSTTSSVEAMAARKLQSTSNLSSIACFVNY